MLCQEAYCWEKVSSRCYQMSGEIVRLVVAALHHQTPIKGTLVIVTAASTVRFVKASTVRLALAGVLPMLMPYLSFSSGNSPYHLL